MARKKPFISSCKDPLSEIGIEKIRKAITQLSCNSQTYFILKSKGFAF